MNDKFKILALQAKMGTADFDAGSYYVATPDQMQKFCELVVRDLIDSMIKRYGDDDELPIQEIKLFVKEHFGVECERTN